MSDEKSTTDMIKDLGFNTNGVYKLYPAKGDTRSVQVGTFQGSASFTIWDSAVRGAPVQSIPFTRELVELFIQNLNKILGAQPNTTLTIEKQTYVKEGDRGKYEKDIFFKFHKNDKQTYTLEFSSKKLETPVVTVFKMSGIDIGNGELSESDKSAVSVKAFVTFLRSELPVHRANSLYNPKPRKFNGGSGGGNGGSGGGGNHYNAPNTTQRYTDNQEPY